MITRQHASIFFLTLAAIAATTGVIAGGATVWITRDGGTTRRAIESAEWQASALPAKGWAVTSAPPPEPTDAEKAAAALPGDIARVRAQIVDAYRERQVLEYIDAASDKPFAVAAERAAITARIAALKAELAELKAKR